jgi:uncharacterized protein (TIGR02145 family)
MSSSLFGVRMSASLCSIAGAMAFLIASCNYNNVMIEPTVPEVTGYAQVCVKIGRVGALAKKLAIELDTLFITLSAEGETSVNDKFPISGNTQQTVIKNYTDLASLKTWTLTAVAKDVNGEVTHTGQTSFEVPKNDSIQITLNLPALYSMLRANFSPIRDSVTACSLSVDGMRLAGAVFTAQSKLGQTVALDYDYLDASPAPGVPHTVRMDVYGVMWGDNVLLYSGERAINVISGVNASYTITLAWVGPAAPSPGDAVMTVILGTVGTVTIDGGLENRNAPVYGTLTDIDGNVYTTRVIGNQEWTVENLRVTRLNDGTPIPQVTGANYNIWYGLSTPAYCFFGFSTNQAGLSGALYNWYAVGTGNLAPAGWRVPTDTDWAVLENYLIANGYNYDGTTTGNKIAKAMAAKTDWLVSTNLGAVGNDLNANNSSGFSALQSGILASSTIGSPVQWFHGDATRWWSSTETGASALWHGLYYNSELLLRDYQLKNWGLSVRLVRDN